MASMLVCDSLAWSLGNNSRRRIEHSVDKCGNCWDQASSLLAPCTCAGRTDGSEKEVMHSMKMSLASHGRGKIPLQMAVRDTTKWGLESSQAGPAEDLAVKALRLSKKSRGTLRNHLCYEYFRGTSQVTGGFKEAE